jgi:microcystin-dependent protein
VGEIRMFGGNFAPLGWMLCEGQLLPIAENETLFQLIGTTYGGDGESTFALPDLRGRIPIHAGAGHLLAEAGGMEAVFLAPSQLPAHAHGLQGSSGMADASSPAGRALARSSGGPVYATGSPTLMSTSIQPAGGGAAHENMQPFLCVSFIISLFGIFPSPS